MSVLVHKEAVQSWGNKARGSLRCARKAECGVHAAQKQFRVQRGGSVSSWHTVSTIICVHTRGFVCVHTANRRTGKLKWQELLRNVDARDVVAQLLSDRAGFDGRCRPKWRKHASNIWIHHCTTSYHLVAYKQNFPSHRAEKCWIALKQHQMSVSNYLVKPGKRYGSVDMQKLCTRFLQLQCSPSRWECTSPGMLLYKDALGRASIMSAVCRHLFAVFCLQCPVWYCFCWDWTLDPHPIC
jgi:hypothetical protein